MNKQFAQLQVYQLGGGIAFGLPTTTTPFLVIPSGQATIKPWGNSGFLFENIVTGDVIAFVNDYDDVLDSSDAAYGVDQPSVFTALAAFFFDLAGGGGSLATLSDVSLSSPSYGDYLEYNGTAWVNRGIVYTIELIDVLTVDFYAPYDLKINSVTDILNTPTTTIDDDGVAYVLGATIAAGSKITITVDTAAVVNLNIEKA